MVFPAGLHYFLRDAPNIVYFEPSYLCQATLQAAEGVGVGVGVGVGWGNDCIFRRYFNLICIQVK